MYNPPLDGLDGPNVLALYEEGLPLTVIAEATGRRVSVVQAWLVRRGHHEPVGRPDRQRVEGWYARGQPVEVIADRLGVSKSFVHQVARRAGMRRAPRPPTPEEQDRIVELYLAGGNIRRIALATRWNRTTVRTVLRRRGVYDPARSAATRPARVARHPWRAGAEDRRKRGF